MIVGNLVQHKRYLVFGGSRRGGRGDCDTQVNSMVTPYIFNVWLCTKYSKSMFKNVNDKEK
jgi:hypothetical protein